MKAAAEPTDPSVNPQSSPNALSPLPEKERRRLARLLRRAGGFALAFVECNRPRAARRVVKELESALVSEDRRVRELKLGEPAGDLYARLAEMSAKASDVLVVIGFERSFEPGAQVSSALARVNMSREHFRKLPCPVVLFLPEFALTRMAREAPDFWAWRSGVFKTIPPRFRLDLLSSRPLADSGLGTLSLEQKRAHLEVLRETLAEHERNGVENVRELSYLNRRIAVFLDVLGNLEDAEQHARRAVELAPEGDREQVMALGELARISLSRGDVESALVLYDERLAVVEALGDRHARAVTLGEIVRIRISQDEMELALSLGQEVLAIFEELGDRRNIAVVLGDIALIHFKRDELEVALALNEDRLVIAEELGDLHLKVAPLQSLAWIHLEQGKVQKALDELNESYSIVSSLGLLEGISMVGHDLGRLLCETGQLDQGRQILRRSLDGYRDLGQLRNSEQVENLLTQFPDQG